MWPIIAIAAIVLFVVSIPVTSVLTKNRITKSAHAKIGNAEADARKIIDDALKEAEAKKRESLLEIKEESIRSKNELDKEIKERRTEVSKQERRLQQKEESLDKTIVNFER